MEGLELSLAAAEGLVVDEAFTWVDRGRIVQNAGGGVLAQNGAELVLRNCFVGGNAEANVLDIQGSTATVLYSSVGAGLGVTAAVVCDAGSMVDVRNSILVSRSNDDELQCTMATVNNSATELDIGGTNTSAGPMEVSWFEDFNSGDFHLTTMVPIAVGGAARWEEGDPPTDIDGDPRPAVDATPDYAGADVPQ